MNRAYFKNPEGMPEYAAGCFWFWNDRIEEKEMLRQQKLMKEHGLELPMIHSRFGREIDYMGEEWISLVKSSLKCAKDLGQKMWLYDEDNWPSGTCSKSVTREEAFREHFLRMDEVEGEDWPGYHNRIEHDRLLEVWDADGEEETLLWTAEDPLEDLPSENQSQESRGKRIVIRWDVKTYEEGGRSCVDYLNPDAIALFMEKTHKKYRKEIDDELFAQVMGFFMDETRFYYCYPWTGRFASEFKNRKGYSVLGKLRDLFRTGVRTQAELDYLDVAAQLYKEATFQQVYDWCEKNGVNSTAHLLGEETLSAQTRFEIDLMRQYEAMHIPGLDHLGRGIGSLDAKFVVSAARNYGKDRVCCEAFGASGWETGIEDVIRISNWLIQQGVNMISAHGYYYSTRDERKNDFPPSYFFQWKDWDKMKDYNRMSARMMELASGGKHFGNILVYYPIETFWKYYRPDPLEKTGFGEKGSRIENRRAAQIDREYQKFLNGLSDRNVPFQIINSDSVGNYEIREGKWINTLNGEIFHTFVLLDTEILPEETKEKLLLFEKTGGKIFSCRSDVKLEGTEDFSDIQSLTQECEKVTDLGIDILEGTCTCQHNVPAYPDHLIDPFIHNGEDLYGVGISRYEKDGYRIYNFTNYNLREEQMVINVNDAKSAEIWNPENGEIELQDGTCVRFAIPPNRTRYLVAR